jgi:hypothetical protein
VEDAHKSAAEGNYGENLVARNGVEIQPTQVTQASREGVMEQRAAKRAGQKSVREDHHGPTMASSLHPFQTATAD